MVEQDLNKKFLDSAITTPGLILIDFIDDRYPLLDFGSGVLCTESDEFKSAGLQVVAKKIAPFSDQFFERWNIGWEIFLNHINMAGKSKKIIINKVFLAQVDEKGSAFDQIDFIKKMNQWLNRVYSRISDDLPQSQFIDYIGMDWVARSDHKWGRSPYHFTETHEKFAVNFLNNYSEISR